MSFAAYLKDRRLAALIYLACAAVVGGMFPALGAGFYASALAIALLLFCGAALLALDYLRRRRFYRELDLFMRDFDARYLAASLVEQPDFLEGRLAFDALEAAGRDAADELARQAQELKAYRDYIELWIHEIKTPIAAAGLIAASQHGDAAERIKDELDRIEGFVEQALYYARSTSLEQDYAIREITLAEVVRSTLKKHARYLIEKKTLPSVEVADEVRVFADAKQLAFIIGQAVTNAAKYGARTVRFTARMEKEGSPDARTVLEIADDGRGIPAADVPRVFERGFTGENGRVCGFSTGMGLYIVAELCATMGLAVAVASEEGAGTRLLLSFPHDRRRLDLQS